MAKIKNRASRKKAALKKINQAQAKEPPLFFNGYMKIPLDPFLHEDDVKRKTTYSEDWVTMRNRILNEPRWYRVTSHVFKHNVEKPAVSTAYYPHAGTNDSLAYSAQAAFDATREGSGSIDMAKSYICIRA